MWLTACFKQISKNMKEKGFTLLETVIAIGILVMVGAVAVGASTRAINTGTYSKNRTRAQDIARGQIEGLKVIRDNNYKAGKDWNLNLGACDAGYVVAQPQQIDVSFVCGDGGTSVVDPLTFNIVTKIGSVKDDLNGNDNGTFQGKTDKEGGYPSGLDENKNMRRVTVTVTWTEPFLPGDQEVKLVSYLTNDKISN